MEKALKESVVECKKMNRLRLRSLQIHGLDLRMWKQITETRPVYLLDRKGTIFGLRNGQLILCLF